MNYFIIALAGVLAGAGCAIHGQVGDLAAPSRPGQPETTVLDATDIDTRRGQSSTEAALGGSVHPGTAILDSMGIFAGEPAQPSAFNGKAQAASTVKPN